MHIIRTNPNRANWTTTIIYLDREIKEDRAFYNDYIKAYDALWAECKEYSSWLNRSPSEKQRQLVASLRNVLTTHISDHPEIQKLLFQNLVWIDRAKSAYKNDGRYVTFSSLATPISGRDQNGLEIVIS